MGTHHRWVAAVIWGGCRYTGGMSADACLISLDTATDVAHLALSHGGRVWTRVEGGGAQASSSTLPALQALLHEAGLTWSDVQAIGFGQGPGAFTGLRTACAIAQGLALGLSLPVLPLDTLMAVAESARRRSPALAQVVSAEPDHVLWVLQDARMSEVYAAPYRWREAGWQALAAPVLWSLGHWSERVAAGELRHVCGSALRAYAGHAEALSTQGALCVPEAVPEGAALAFLAQETWSQGGAIDAALALPRYVRDKVAQTTAERQQAAA